jgi:hypothetical protein
MPQERTICTYKWRNNDSNDQGNNISPHWHCDVLFDDNNKAKDKAEYKDNHVPPPGDFLVILCHVLMVSVVVSPGSSALECALDVTAPEEDSVSNKSADLIPKLACVEE